MEVSALLSAILIYARTQASKSSVQQLISTMIKCSLILATSSGHSNYDRSKGGCHRGDEGLVHYC